MRNNHRFRLDVWGYLTLFITLLYLVFLVWPVGSLFLKSVYNDGFTLDYFIKFFSKSYYSTTLLNSLSVSVAATFCAIAVGAPIAYFLSIYHVHGKKLLQILIIIASMSPPFIGAYSWILLMGRSGLITSFFADVLHLQIPAIYGFGGIVLVFTLKLFPLVFLYVNGAMKNIDNSLLEASRQLGCKGIRQFFKIIIPLILPTLFAAGLLVFMRALADFGTPMLIGEGYRTFPQLIYTEFVGEMGGDDGFAAAISVIAILITMVVFVIQKYFSNKKSFTMNALHPIEEKRMSRKVAVFVYVFCYGMVAMAILPQCYVIYTSFLRTSGLVFQSGFSLDSYTSMFSTLGTSIKNTLIIPLTALVIILVLAVLIAYLVVRRNNFLTKILDLLSMIPYIVPGVVLGIALLTTFNKPPLLLSASMAIMVLALVIRRIPYTIRSSVATLMQIPMNIEEAALSLGSSKLKTFFRITVPMMSSGVIAGAILSWVTMISELSTAVILYTTKTQTLTVAIYTQVIRGNYGVAAALSTVLTVLTVLSLLVFMKVSKGKDISL